MMIICLNFVYIYMDAFNELNAVVRKSRAVQYVPVYMYMYMFMYMLSFSRLITWTYAVHFL